MAWPTPRHIRAPGSLPHPPAARDLDEIVGHSSVRAVATELGEQARFELIPGASHAFLVTRAEKVWRRSVREFLTATVLTADAHATGR